MGLKTKNIAYGPPVNYVSDGIALYEARRQQELDTALHIFFSVPLLRDLLKNYTRTSVLIQALRKKECSALWGTFIVPLKNGSPNFQVQTMLAHLQGSMNHPVDGLELQRSATSKAWRIAEAKGPRTIDIPTNLNERVALHRAIHARWDYQKNVTAHECWEKTKTDSELKDSFLALLPPSNKGKLSPLTITAILRGVSNIEVDGKRLVYIRAPNNKKPLTPWSRSAWHIVFDQTPLDPQTPAVS